MATSSDDVSENYLTRKSSTEKFVSFNTVYTVGTELETVRVWLSAAAGS